MHRRISTSLTAAALSLPLLAGCGGGPAGASPAAPAAPTSSAAAPSSAPAATTAASPTPTGDPAAEKEAVADASEKFVTVVLTIGYPDKDVDEYADRVEPLMTSAGFASLLKGDSRTSASAAVKKLSEQRARTVPELIGGVKVGKLTGDRATAKVGYKNRAQVRAGGGWKTVKQSGKETATVTLVKEDGKWLVENAT
jgi:hypothetical protein